MGNKILLADKSITIQKIVELTFSDDEYEIRCVNDGQSALEAIPQVRPDLILADISLPVKSGYELCETLRRDPAFAEFARTPIILLAGIYETMDEERARAVEERVREVGANDLLSKPFDPQLLTTKVKELMASSAPAYVDDSVSRTQNIFAETMEPDTTLTAPPGEPEQEYDTEKTIMLPGPPAFSSNVFAEAPPFEPSDVDLQQATVKLDSVTSMNEPIFEEAELQSLPDVPETAEEAAPSIDFSDSSFIPREEPEFSFESSEETVVSRDALFATQAEEPAFQPAEEDQSTTPQPPVIAPEVDEPFGDVFETPPEASAWSGASTSEEDSPFGVPEPPPAPVQEVEEPAPVTMAKDAETTGPIRIPPELQWSKPAETSTVEEPKEEMEEREQEAEITPVFVEDTWSRERSLAGERTAEELFESEPSQDTVPAVEEAVELHPDLSEGVSAESGLTEKPSVVQAEVATSQPEITEELINRIADRVVGKLSERIISEIVWQVVPDLAEKMIRRELEKLHAGEE